MSKTRHKWDDKNRHDFYADLLRNFGPWKNWDTKLNPFSRKGVANRRKHIAFKHYLEAKYPNKKPLAQLTWLGNMSALGLVPDPNSKLPVHEKPLVTQKFNQRNWWQNKNSAYFADFVGDEVFPDAFTPDYPINKGEAWGQDKVQGGGLEAIHKAMTRIPPDDPIEISYDI